MVVRWQEAPPSPPPASSSCNINNIIAKPSVLAAKRPYEDFSSSSPSSQASSTPSSSPSVSFALAVKFREPCDNDVSTQQQEEVGGEEVEATSNSSTRRKTSICEEEENNSASSSTVGSGAAATTTCPLLTTAAVEGDSIVSIPDGGVSCCIGLLSDDEQPEELVDQVLSFCDDSCLRRLRGTNQRLKRLAERILSSRVPCLPPPPLPHQQQQKQLPQEDQQQQASSSSLPRVPPIVLYHQDGEQEVQLQSGWSIDNTDALIEQMFSNWDFLNEGFLPEGVVLKFPRDQAVEQLRAHQHCDLHKNRYSGMHLKAQIYCVEYPSSPKLDEEEEGDGSSTSSPPARSPPLLEVLQFVQNGFLRRDLEGRLPCTEHIRLRNDAFNLLVRAQQPQQGLPSETLEPLGTPPTTIRYALAEFEYRSSHHGLIARRRICSLMFQTPHNKAHPQHQQPQKMEFWSFRSTFCFGARRCGRR